MVAGIEGLPYLYAEVRILADKFYQCCYTNLVTEDSNISNSGWQSVACSSDLPGNVRGVCNPVHGAYSGIAKEVLITYGKLEAWHIFSDAKFMYMTCCNYGGNLDIRGRANMFAHTFCIPCSESGVIQDPNAFLGISEVNFKDNVVDAQKIPSKLIYDEPFNIKSAMQLALMSEDSYRTLIHCVFAQMSDKKVTEPLYVGYSGDILEMKAILYCIYMAVPYYIRKKLVCETETIEKANNGNLIFSQNASRHQRYLLPTTGENTVLNKRISNTISKNEFVDYALNIYFNRTHDESVFNRYFDSLEKCAILYGDNMASDGRILKISHLQITGKINVLEKVSNEEIQQRLSDAVFAAKSISSERLDEYILFLMQEVMKRNMTLSDGVEENLSSVVASHQKKGLSDIYDKYSIYQFINNDVAVAADKLKGMPNGMFDDFIKKLANYSGGLDIINYYYLNLAVDGSASWDELIKIGCKLNDLRGLEDAKKHIATLAWNKYCSEVREDALLSYNSYLNYVERAFPQTNLDIYQTRASEVYWKNMKINGFSFDMEREYSTFYNDKSPKSNFVRELIDIVKTYDEEEWQTFAERLNSLFVKHSDMITPYERDYLLSKIIKRINDIEDVIYDGTDVQNEAHNIRDKWIEIALLSPGDVFYKIIHLTNMIQNIDFGNLNKMIGSIIDGIKGSVQEKRLRNPLNDVLIDACYDVESSSSNDIISLDVWLSIGRFKYRNQCDILDYIDEALVFQCDPEETAMKSKFLMDRIGRKCLNDYIVGGGKNAKIAKKWLSVADQRAKMMVKSDEVHKGKSSDVHGVKNSTRNVNTKNIHNNEKKSEGFISSFLKKLFDALFNNKRID